MPEKRRELMERAAELIERGKGLQMVIPQDTGFFTVEPERIQGILGLLDDASVLMREVTAHFEDESHSMDIAEAVLTPQELADLAFLGRNELQELHSSLEQAATASNTWKIVSETDRSVTRSIRALIPIEAALRDYQGLEPIRRRWFDLDDALEIRQCYIRFWLEARRAAESAGDIAERLRHFSTLIAELRRTKIYPYLRIDDRLEIRAVQKRIFAYLEEPGDDAQREGQRLWQDMVGFFDLLMQINRREELLDHDRLMVGRIYRELSDPSSTPERLPIEMHRKLMSLASQEPDLDDLLLNDEPARSVDYLGPLGKLRDRLMQG